MWDWISKLDELRRDSRPAVLVTVTKSTGSTPREIGAKMIVLADGTFFGTIGGGSIEHLALADARRCLEEGESKTIDYPLYEKAGMVCGGRMELLMDVLNQNPRLYLFGAGHVGQALCQTLVGTPFTVHLVDDREEWILSQKLPKEVIRHPTHWNAFISSAAWDEKTFVAIMTPEHKSDQEVTQAVIKHPARYIGLMGSTKKWQEVKTNLLRGGATEEELARITCPIGLPIGGKSPQEIAISIAAELLKIHYGK